MKTSTATNYKGLLNATKRTHRWINFAIIVLIIGSLSACQPSAIPVVPPPTAAASSDAIQLPKHPLTTNLDPALSTISLYVYRGGRLAHLGHNHVITVSNPRGTLKLHPNLQKCGLHLTIPVTELQVDNPQARVRAGAAFSGEVSAKDIKSTRRNMLSPKVLDAENHPFIEISTLGLSGSPPLVQAELELTIRGVTRIITTQVQLGMDKDQLQASGVIELSQKSFGIEPIRILGGAITVMDRIDVHFRLIAKR